MDCQRAVEALIDRASGHLDPAAAEALAAHLDACTRCRAEAAEIDGLWNDLGALRTVPAAAHTDAMADRLRKASAGAGARPGWLRAALWAALLLGAGLIGRATAGTTAATPGAAPDPRPQWMLLLHEDPEPDEASPAVIAQYADWANRLAADGRLVNAEKLDGDPGLWLPARPADSRITGFFIVRAPDEAAAAAIARDGPHLSNGGAIEVRRIDPGGGRP